jgi:hypothetical protein
MYLHFLSPVEFDTAGAVKLGYFAQFRGSPLQGVDPFQFKLLTSWQEWRGSLIFFGTFPSALSHFAR